MGTLVTLADSTLRQARKFNAIRLEEADGV
jgi:hypothetical protein